MRQDVYGVAYAEAKSELLDITCKFEQLKARKARLEGVVAAVGSILEAPSPRTEAAAPVADPLPTTEPEPAQAQAPADPSTYSFNRVPVPLPCLEESDGDPFKRRVRSALSFKSATREPRGLQTAV